MLFESVITENTTEGGYVVKDDKTRQDWRNHIVLYVLPTSLPSLSPLTVTIVVSNPCFFKSLQLCNKL